jgi:hypothetical protein
MHSRAPLKIMVLCCICEKPAFDLYEPAPLCWWCCRTYAEAQQKSVAEVVADSYYEEIEIWILREFMDRVTAVRPKLATKVEGLLEHLDDLTVGEAAQFASFTPMEREFLRSRLSEIMDAAVGAPA